MNAYQFPEIITEIEELQERGLITDEEFEFWIDYHENDRYSICPIDAIPFASTGNNGIHFAFLTDFGRNKDLNEAPIICVAPTYDPPINIVAKNINHFLSLVTTIENSTLFANRYKDQEEFDKRKKEWFDGFLSELRVAEPRRKLANELRDRFKLDKFENIVNYRHRLRQEREEQIDHTSMDGLGIFKVNDKPIIEFDYSKNPEDVIKFLSQSNRNSRLLFYRNSYFAYILSKEYDEVIKSILIQYLKQDGYEDEANRLKLY